MQVAIDRAVLVRWLLACDFFQCGSKLNREALDFTRANVLAEMVVRTDDNVA
jgi:hypothetical protein